MIRDLQVRSNAVISLERDAARGTGAEGRVPVTYRGRTREGVALAKSLVERLCADEGSSDVLYDAGAESLPLGDAASATRRVARSAARSIVGSGGEMVRLIQSASGARVRVGRAGGGAGVGRMNDREGVPVTITGTTDAVKRAGELIENILKGERGDLGGRDGGRGPGLGGSSGPSGPLEPASPVVEPVGRGLASPVARGPASPVAEPATEAAPSPPRSPLRNDARRVAPPRASPRTGGEGISGAAAAPAAPEPTNYVERRPPPATLDRDLAPQPSAVPDPTPDPSPPSIAPRESFDWRDLFRSLDYDDPWSPYVPFERSADASISGDGAPDKPEDVVRRVLDGTWKRRRHGMGLEPLVVTLTRPHEEGEVDEEAIWLEKEDDVGEYPRDVDRVETRAQWLDAQTRFLCRMLDDLYRTGTRRETDRPRTERCHRAIGRLLSLTPQIPEEGPDFVVTGLAQRAGAILQRMELCSPPGLRGSGSDDGDDGNEEEAPVDALPAGSYQGLYPDFPRHLSNTKFALPSPTREIYNMVLFSYAKESGEAHVAREAENVVWSMIVRATRPPAGRVGEEEQSDDAILPSIENWLCVLQCWSWSADPDRAFHAYSFLRSWTEWNERCGRGDRDIYSPDAASVSLVLDACLAREDDRDHGRAREIGSGVAVRLWKELPRLGLRLDSAYTYDRIIEAISQTTELPAASSRAGALQALATIYSDCHEAGMATERIKAFVEAATTEAQFAQIQAKLESKP
ncbi:hypothetical protein ACHAWF_007105 [Thalassiosira exigua]